MFETEEILAAVRAVFTEAGELPLESALVSVGRELGFLRVSAKSREAIRNVLITAVRRGVIINTQGVYSIHCRRIVDYNEEFLEKCFYAAIGRAWCARAAALRAAAPALGSRPTGTAIVDAFEGGIRRGLRRRELEREEGLLRRAR
jgi:hypothetical protein